MTGIAEIEVTAFNWVPPFPRGLVRDLRVRWALEEAGLDYATVLFDRRTSGPEDRQPEQPFGQVPAYREGEVRMFESGAICLHIAERSDALLPLDLVGRTRAMSWLFASLGTLELYVFAVQCVTLFGASHPGAAEFAPFPQGMLRDKLDQLSTALGDKDWLEDRFTVADLMMVTVLRQLARPGILADHPVLAAYVARGEARPAFQKALADHMNDFIDN